MIKKFICQFLLFSSLCFICWGLYTKVQSQQIEIDKAYTNLKAYIAETDSLKQENRAYKYSIDELKISKDSINKKLLQTTQQLKIKEKDIAYLEYQLSNIAKTDTIIIQDTIFQSTVNIDTLLADKWYQLNLKLKYPNTVIITPTFKSERTVIGSLKKETLKPPKKFFVCRWFQKKHKVLIIDVVEKNPYITIDKERYIQVIN